MQTTKEQKEQYVTIRLATKDDLKWIKKINEESLPENYDKRTYLRFFYSYPGLMWVAEHGKRIVGYVMAQVKGVKIMRGHIFSIAVSDKFRGRGIGSNLMEAVETQLTSVHNVHFITLHVRESNVVGIRLYTSTMGYKIKKTMKYYPDGENALYMVKYFDTKSE